MNEQIIRELKNYEWTQEQALLSINAELPNYAYAISGVLGNLEERLSNLDGEIDEETRGRVGAFFLSIKQLVAVEQQAFAQLQTTLPLLDQQSQTMDLTVEPGVIIIPDDETEAGDSDSDDSDSDSDDSSPDWTYEDTDPQPIVDPVTNADYPYVGQDDDGSNDDDTFAFGGDSADFIDSIV